ncbi:MAG: class II fumarate hydratase [bacterium]
MVKVKDSMGEMKVPKSAYYGASTQRAVENFPVSGYTMPEEIIRALALIKHTAARVNSELGLLSDDLADAISQSAQEVMEGKFRDQFLVDVFQTGSGTSTNMNMNEVIAARANEILGKNRQGRSPVHPNDHVNMGQSSNDVIPSAIHIAARLQTGEKLIPALVALRDSLIQKSEEFEDVIKVGRTHMQDAVPVTLGQEFSAWASQVRDGIVRIRDTFNGLEGIPLGGTAVGTGLNSHPEFGNKAAVFIAEETKVKFRTSDNIFADMGGKDALSALSGTLSVLGTSLIKIASDIRFLASGPYTGIGEIRLPTVQPGSSIMPGKINPVILESVIQAAFRVVGNNVTVSMANSSGNLELNVSMPLLGFVITESITLLAGTSRLMSEKSVSGIEVDRDRCSQLLEKSLALVTPLAQKIGYDKAAEIAKEAQETGKTIRDIALDKQVLEPEELKEILDPEKMV